MGQVGERQVHSRSWTPPVVSVSASKLTEKTGLEEVAKLHQASGATRPGDSLKPQFEETDLSDRVNTQAPIETISIANRSMTLTEPVLDVQPSESNPVDSLSDLEAEASAMADSMQGPSESPTALAPEPETMAETSKKKGEVASCDPDDSDQMYFKPSIIPVDDRTWVIPQDLVGFYANNPAN